MHRVAAHEAVRAARRLARDRYATGGRSVGAVAVVARRLARTLPAGKRVVAVFPNGPQRYVGTVYDDTYCRTHGRLDRTPADDPDEIAHPGERTVTRWTRCTHVGTTQPKGAAR